MLGAQPEVLGRVVVLVNGSTVRAGELGRAAHDRSQHGFQVQRRADRLTDLAERPQLTHRARQIWVRVSSSLNSRTFSMAMTAWSAKVLHLDLFVREGPDLVAPDVDRADGHALPQHRHGENGAVPQRLTSWVGVVRVQFSRP